MKKLLLIFCISIGFINAQETITLYIQDGNDDAFQKYYLYFESTDSVGDIFVDKEYLEMGFNAWPEDPPFYTYHIGLRYVNVPIPLGSEIVSAHIQFTSYIANIKPDKVIIRGEKNPSPQSFADVDFNITNRQLTDSYIIWELEEWQAFIPGPAQKTPNLNEIVQEIIDQPDWAENKPMAFIIGGYYTLLSDTTMPRQATSYEFGGEFYAPILEIKYKKPALIHELSFARSVSIYPNPVSNKFTVSLTELQKGEYEISLHSIIGQKTHLFHKEFLSTENHELIFNKDELNLQPGVYIISIKNEKATFSQKMVIN